MRHICLYIGVKIFSAYVRTGSPEVEQEALADLKKFLSEMELATSSRAINGGAIFQPLFGQN